MYFEVHINNCSMPIKSVSLDLPHSRMMGRFSPTGILPCAFNLGEAGFHGEQKLKIHIINEPKVLQVKIFRVIILCKSNHFDFVQAVWFGL